ncbi:MAG: hypothetical protein ABI821_15140 [Pseudomonadota bacterium]
MENKSHLARITGPVPYLSETGRKRNIPIGPCLVESIGGKSVDVVWGVSGQRSVTLPVEEIEAARDQGRLMLVD